MPLNPNAGAFVPGAFNFVPNSWSPPPTGMPTQPAAHDDTFILPQAVPPPEEPMFIECAAFDGAKPGYAFRMGDEGLGYYRDATAASNKNSGGEKKAKPKKKKPRALAGEDGADAARDQQRPGHGDRPALERLGDASCPYAVGAATRRRTRRTNGL